MELRHLMKNILFYKYVNIEDPQKCRDELFTLCQSLDTKGKILVAEEGINGCISGTETNIEKFKKELTNRFSDIVFKEDDTNQHTFKKIFVRVRKEIITSNFGIKLENKAPYVEPKQLKEWLDNNEDIIMVDARNDYEVHHQVASERAFPCAEILASARPTPMAVLERIKRFSDEQHAA